MSSLTQGPVSGPTKSYIADTAIVAGCAVAAGANPGHVVTVNAAGQRAIGIADLDAAAGAVVRVTRAGDAIGIGGGAIAAGQYLKTTATGHLIAIAGAAGSGEEIVGRAESAAVADGDQVIVFLTPGIN